MPKTGVFPVFENMFRIGTAGLTSAAAAMRTIAEMENFSVAIDGNTVEWSPFEMEGWLRRLNTGKSFSITMSGKRCPGDAGNDYVESISFMTGRSCSTKFEWEFPSGAKLTFNCVINVTNLGGGESRDVGPLEFEVLSDGKPTFTPAA